jgi:ATP-dependent DNA helicase RecQ
MGRKTTDRTPDLARIARERFGFPSLRPGQAEAVEAVLDGRDTLAVLPTGAGKSFIYQLSALLLDGPTVVVSPLIALQRDQVAALEEHGTLTAAESNSTVTAAERRESLEAFARGELELLLLAPEQFNDDELLDQLKAGKPSLLVVDEAHCVSSWGHDFRPEYLRVGAVGEALGHPRVLALTATASPPIRAEIVERLHMRDPLILVRGFDRPNIGLAVRPVTEAEDKLEDVLTTLAAAPKPGIVYVATRRGAEELAAALRDRDVRAAHYHGAMRTGEREDAQEAFMADEVDVMVATTAFGMGIDKAGVRFVHHFDPPDSLDSYYQEIGRAGRDGKPAEAVLWWRPEDLGVRRFFAGGGLVEVEDLERVATLVGVAGGPVDPAELRETTGLSETKLATAVNRLQDAGALRVLPSGAIEPDPGAPGGRTAAERAAEAEEAHRTFEKTRLEMLRSYAEDTACRRELLLSYFGEPYEGPCGNCDNDARAGTPPVEENPDVFPPGTRVRHPEWGGGQVLRTEDDRVTVLFDEGGYRTLGLGLVLERGLLEIDAGGS